MSANVTLRQLRAEARRVFGLSAQVSNGFEGHHVVVWPTGRSTVRIWFDHDNVAAARRLALETLAAMPSKETA